MFGTILVCSDGSESAVQAARVGAALAKRLGSRLVLLSVFDTGASAAMPQIGAWDLLWSQKGYDCYVQEAHEAIERRTQGEMENEGAFAEPLRAQGHPIAEIVRTARDCMADVVVLGSRGLGAWSALFLGSVSRGVLHHAPCAVLIVRGDKTGFGRILLGTDGSESARRATSASIFLGKKLGAPLTVLNVCPSLEPVTEDAARSLGKPAQRRLLDFVAQATDRLLAEAGLSSTIRQEEGHPAEVISRVARTEGFDLIVLGSRGMGGFGSLLLGSVSEQVVEHAPCPVLVVR